MKGQVFTIAKLDYVNGVVYEIAKQGKNSADNIPRRFALIHVGPPELYSRASKLVR